MKRTTSFRRITALLLALLSAAMPILAAEGTISCDYIEITGEDFVADRMNGVEALYNLRGRTLYCVELVERYYEEVYGLDLLLTDHSIQVENNSDLYFEETDIPRSGDIMFGSASARGKSYSHWGIVKEWDGDTLTVFEQNWRWGNYAGINRIIEYPNSCYKIFTLKSASGKTVSPLPGSAARMSAWAEPYLRQAAEERIGYLNHDYQSSVTRDTFCQMALNILADYGVLVNGTGAQAALTIGLVSDGDGSKLLTREEAACIVSRLSSWLGNPQLALPAALDSYTDAASISFWAQDAVAQATVSGLMNGLQGYFAPKEPLTNEQAVTIMVRVKTLAEKATYQRARVPAGGVAALISEKLLSLPALPRTSLMQ